MERVLRQKLPHGRFIGVSRERSECMRAVRGRGNKTTEGRLRAAIVRARIRGWCIAPQNILGRPDFYFGKAKLAVFVDGCFWHGCPRCGHLPKANKQFWQAKIHRNKTRDRKISVGLRASGTFVLRLWEHELSNNLARCVERIHSSISKSRTRGPKQ